LSGNKSNGWKDGGNHSIYSMLLYEVLNENAFLAGDQSFR